MKYVLMQAPRKEEDYSSQIEIVDNSKISGEKRVEHLVEMGYTYVGTIESVLSEHRLKRGFSCNADKQVDAMHGLFRQISTLADSHTDLAYEVVH